MTICTQCGQFIKTHKARHLSPDMLKLVGIMNKNQITLKNLEYTLGISKRTLMNWMNDPHQKIKPTHVDMLRLKGYAE